MIMKRKLLSLLMLLMTAVTGAWAQGPWDSGDCTVTLSGGVMTVSGTGAMEDYGDVDDQPWKDYRTSITSVVVGSGVTSIGDLAFEDCTNLASVTFASDSQLSNIGLCAFQNSGLTTIEIPAKVTTIGMSAFTECSSLATVTFATGSLLETIDVAAFYQCTNLTSVTLPDGLTTIGITAFSECTNLPSITIPASVTSIGMNAFDNCTSLATVTLNGNPFIDDFAFLNVSATVTMNLTANSAGGAYWMTFYNKNYSFTADGSTTIYKAAVNSGNTAVVLTEVDDIPANNAAVLKSSNEVITMTLASSTNGDYTGNELQGAASATVAAAGDNVYCLSNETTREGGLTPRGVGFYTYTGTIPVNRAYLVISDGPTSARGFLGIDDDDNTTAIDAPKALSAEADGTLYDLSGRRVMGQPQKGIYVKNGKKFVIK